MATRDVKLISVSIERDWRSIYEFAADPTNLSKWAEGLGSEVEKSGDAWIALTPHGPIRIRFSPPNDFGVLDHVVILESGDEIPVPLRVVANGTGGEVTLTLFRTPEMTDESFEADAEMVRRDLLTLKLLLES